MNVFDVHVNRSPIAGRVADSHYVKGAFVNASLNKANIDNERLAHILETDMPLCRKLAVCKLPVWLRAEFYVMWMLATSWPQAIWAYSFWQPG